MCARAQILVSYTTYPHVDMRATGQRTAELLHRTMSGEIAPVTLRAHRPMLEEASGGRTDMGPMIDRHVRARAFEARNGVYAVSINGAFPCADIADVGPTVLITCAQDTPAFQSIAESIADDIWDRRDEPLNTYLTCAQAADVAQNWTASAGPLVIADYADNPGAGAYGDGTNLLAALLEAGITNACFGPLVDPVAAKTLLANAVGTEVTLDIGGATDPDRGGGPLSVTGTLKWAGAGRVIGSGPMLSGLARDFGTTAVLDVRGIEVLIVSTPHQMLDLQQFATFGIDPAQKSVVALKSMQHFRAAFTPIAGRIIICDSGALCTLDYASLPYENVPRPTYPLP
jgi:microcystin degradation protein MlrC